MKKKLLLVLLIGLFLVVGCTNDKKTTKKVNEPKKQEVKNNYVSYNGNLKVKGTKLQNEKGEDIVLRGMSSHGLQWFGDLITEENIKILKEEWNTNVFRLAMYTEEGGYIQDKSIKDKLEKYIDLLVKNDMYIIVDWHILTDNNPNNHINEAKEFFDYMSNKYKDTPNILYEICNEPNGGVNWNDQIKPYAEEIVKTIRKNDKKKVIIVGTSTWSQDVDSVINNKVSGENIMYTLHFYAGTHKDDLRSRVKNALNNGVAVFVTEFGTTDASGDGGPYLDETQKWIDFMKENNLSFINWSLSNKDEKSAILKPGYNKITDDALTESGKFIKKALK